MFCRVDLLIPLASSHIESIFLEALALEGALWPEAPAATFSQGEADGEHACQGTPVLQGPFLLFLLPALGATFPTLWEHILHPGHSFLKGFAQATLYSVAQATEVICKKMSFPSYSSSKPDANLPRTLSPILHPASSI